MVLPSVTAATTITWTAVGPDGVTPASGDWSNFNNWTDARGIHRLPDASDDVYINAPGITVDHYSGVDTIHSLNTTANVTIDGGSLTVTGGINLTGGTALTLGPTATLVVDGTQSIEGDGNVVFSSSNPSSQIDLTGGTTWTIGSGIVVEGKTGSIGPAPGGASNFYVVNDGTVGASVVGGALLLTGGTWDNLGIIEALNGATTDLDATTLANVSGGTLTGGTWEIADSNSLLELNSPDIITNDATILLDGPGVALTAVTGGGNLLADLANNPGSLTLQGGATLTTDTGLNNSGLVDIEVDSTLNVGGVYTQTDGTTIVNGTLNSTAFTMNIDGGTLLGDGTVFAVINPPSAAPSTLHHERATATVSLGNLAPTYDGAPEAVLATTTPAGFPVDITYNGSSTVPTEAGTYAVTATIDDLNYQGSATGTLVIGRATPTVAVTPVDVSAYDGLAHGTTAVVTGVDGASLGSAVVTYSTAGGAAPVDAGSYTATGSFAGNSDYTPASSTASINIGLATPTVTVTPLNVPAFDGQPHATTGFVTGVNGVLLAVATITYDTSTGTAPVDAGSYTATGSFAGNVDYTSASGTATIAIGRATPATVTVTPVNAIYDGEAQPTTAVVTGVDGVSLGSAAISYNTSDGDAPVDAGTYTATGTFAGNLDYTSATGTATIIIRQATPTVTVAPVFVPAFDGDRHGTTGVVTGVDGISLGSAAISYNTPDGSAPLNAGTYTATGSFPGNTDYTSATGSATISIGRAIPTEISVIPVSGTYDGLARGTTGEVFGVDGADLGPAVITYSGSGGAPVDAGSYTATGSFAGNNNYSSATGTGTITISRATPTVTVTPVTVAAYDGQAHGTTGVVTGVDGAILGNASISYNSSSGSAPTDAGTYTATGTFPGNADYTNAIGTATVFIGKAKPTVAVTPVMATYNGQTHGTTGVVTGVGDVSLGSATITYSTPGSVVPVDAGSYTATGSFAGNIDYTSNSSTAAISIGQATPTVSVAPVSVIYDGQPQGTTGKVFGVNQVDLGPAVVTYSSGSAPVNVGSYTATGSFTGDMDYTSMTGTGPIVIGQAPSSVTLSNLNQIFDGSPELATATTVPAGLRVDLVYNQDGQVVTSPTAAGSYAVTATVDDPNYVDNATGTLVISQTATITSASVTSFTEGTDSTFVVTTANGFPTPALQEKGPLPAGVTFTDNHDGTATLAGVPSAGTEGSYIFVITATNAAGSSAAQTFALNVLTAKELGNLIASVTAIAQDGQASADVGGAQSGQTSVNLAAPGNGPAALWVASYFGNPADKNPAIPLPNPTPGVPLGANTLKVTLQQSLVFVDVRVTGVDKADDAAAMAVFTFPGSAISAEDVSDFAMQYFDGTSWQTVLSDGQNGQPPFKPVPQAGFDAHGNPIWTITVLFDSKSTPSITSLKGTVFTLALPTTAPPTPTVILQPQVSISTNSNSDVGNGLGNSANFASNGQLSLILRVSNENEYTASRTAVGGGGGGDITYLPDADDALVPWLRDVPWIRDMLRPESATPPPAPPRQGAAAPARPAHADAPVVEASTARPDAEESQVGAIGAFFTEDDLVAPQTPPGDDFIFDETDADLAMAVHATPAAVWGFPLAAAVALTLRQEKPALRGCKYRPAIEGRR